ncbi:hypothetical protein GCM10010156_18280 [Planobispora rosea]|uniref:histidine kinase n=1 Tax=Planobispora rosea TaxID=35762 RepID=A0A8J3S1I2_PLARO|nr:histidine kinase [Planobispora rosea]GGS60046.1 hypothetical protein GCM10010156_18280 [Planobispora rosea]GIH84072.1 hypothetical protein Pro02_24800 [Planobispora rosea]
MDVIAALPALAALTALAAAFFAPGVPAAHAAETAGTVSIMVTASYPLLGRQADGGLWMMAETPPLLALVLVAARRAPARRAVLSAGLPGAAVALMLVRVMWPGEPSLMIGGCAGWSLLSIAAAGTGLYLRSLDTAGHRAVTEARRAQRLALARDLHDYVAHDLSGILVQAQAARMVSGPLPPPVADALRRIEEAGQRALASMDRTVEMLHDRPDAGDDHRLPGIESLESLVGGFSPPASLTVTPGLDLPRETSATVYRVVTEALTNVRRHAGAATRVAVEVTAGGGAVRVRITDDGGRRSGTTDQDGSGRDGSLGGGSLGGGSGRGGFGLIGLSERVGVLGGSLTAGPTRDGWHVTAVLPAETVPDVTLPAEIVPDVTLPSEATP